MNSRTDWKWLLLLWAVLFSSALSSSAYASDTTSALGSRQMASVAPESSQSSAQSSALSDASSQRGILPGAPWATFYGAATDIDLTKLAATFRMLDIDADPDQENFTPQQVATLKNGGSNKVLSYFNIGSCEKSRNYWSEVPEGFVSCSANVAAQRGNYDGYPNEVWMDPSNPDYQHLLLDYVAPRLVAQGVDGFYLDNMEIVEHGTRTANGPCNSACVRGALDFVAKLRAKYPNLTIVMQNATGDVTRLGRTSAGAYATLIDGVAHEEVYQPAHDLTAEGELVLWSGMNLRPGGQPFWIGTVDYVGTCSNLADARADYARSRARHFSPYASNTSADQQTVCYWPLLGSEGEQ